MDTHARLQQLLRERGWTEYKLSKECGLAQSTIGNIFRRNTVPSVATLETICKAFGITMSQFFAETDMVELSPYMKEFFERSVFLTMNQKIAVIQMLKAMNYDNEPIDEFCFNEFQKRTHKICFTGHRPEKLVRTEEDIKKDLEIQIRRAIADDLNIFITGMARGTDIWAAQIVLKLREQGIPVKLICACPYDGFEKGWRSEWQKQYRDILEAADFVKYICENYNRSCFQIRNEWMVNHSDRVVAVFNGQKSGTKNTIDYAKKIGVPVIQIKG